MKQITLDYDTYMKELDSEKYKGFKKGIGEARRIFLELLANGSIESIRQGIEEFYDDSGDLNTLVEDLHPRVKIERRRPIKKGEL